MFEAGRVHLAGDLEQESSRQREVYAWMGEAMATRAGARA